MDDTLREDLRNLKRSLEDGDIADEEYNDMRKEALADHKERKEKRKLAAIVPAVVDVSVSVNVFPIILKLHSLFRCLC